ncbi:MAG: T9SS type A sorting domain-containing protein [Ignavibacteriae bacterium]|nr:T9SS type A sorting domain-containing protein [Ignavibacteriota bacterium]
MKNIFFLLILLSCGVLYSQVNNSDQLNADFPIRPRPNPNSPLGTQSTVQTVNGFDNFYLGNDNSEPYIAVNPNDPLNMICAFNSPSATASIIYVTRNGYDWSRVYPPYGGFFPIGDPVMTFDSLGNMYFFEMTENPYGGVIQRSTNKGLNWLSPVQTYSMPGGLCDKPWLTCDQSAGPYSNYLYIGWRYFGAGGGMYFVRSTDKGVSWSSPIQLTGNQGAYLSVGPNGSIPGGNLYYACAGGSGIILYRSTDGGASFTNTGTNLSFSPPGTSCFGRNTVKNCIRTDAFPRMAADNSWTSTRGNLYIVYASNPAGPDLADIFLVKSTNYGTTWSAPVKLNDDATTTDQWMPAITVDKKTGRVFVFWYDSRNDPTGNLMTELYGTVSTDGGNTFTANGKISTAAFNPNMMAIGGGNDAGYMGDYIGNAGIGITSINAWMDDRINTTYTSQSFVGYYPDFAFTINPTQNYVGNNDSTTVTLKVPAIKGPYTDKVKFTAVLDTVPVTGAISFSFANGKDTITSYPDSVYLRIKTTGTVTPPKNYKVIISGAGSNGTPVHKRTFNLLVNSNTLTVQSNRNNTCTFKVNGITYNNFSQFVFPVGTVVNVQAVSPQGTSGTRYVFQNWSDGGDTTHNITINNALNLIVNYKPQYKLLITSAYGTTVGHNQYYDSAVSFTFGVYPRIVYLGQGNAYQFRGWNGSGNGAYTSADSSGMDTMVTMSLSNAVIEYARWTYLPVGINNISSEIPEKFGLHQNYPNPFNPNTNIKFDIAKAGFVSLKVYDILGREVAVLVNDILQPGYYSVPFAINQFTDFQASSGIYFYRITAGDFKDIKKMLIIK